jgi:drug/metabolite transporter (DMT)-like permease
VEYHRGLEKYKMSTPNYRLGLVLVSGSAIAWSLTGLFTRLVPLDVWTTLFWRGMFGALGILVFIRFADRQGLLEGLRKLGKPGWAMVSFSVLAMISFIASLKLSTVAHVSIVYATVPFVAAVMGYWLLKEKPSRSAIIASLIALLGVIVMMGGASAGDLLGDALAFLMTVCMAAIMIIARRWPGIPMLHAAFATALLCAAISFVPSEAASPRGMEWVWLAAFGLVNSALGLALFAIGSRHLPAVETALIGALDGALAPVWVWLVFAETPGPVTLVGGTIVFSAVGLHILYSAKQQ